MDSKSLDCEGSAQALLLKVEFVLEQFEGLYRHRTAGEEHLKFSKISV